MNRFNVGNTVTVQANWVDDNGNALSPSSVTYTVYDECDNVVVNGVAVASPYTSPQSVIIPGNYNNSAGGRRVLFTITSPTGTNYVEQLYQLRNDTQRLTYLVNTFQTYLQAQILANDLVNIPYFQAATEDQCIAALMEAYYRLTRFGYLVKWPEYVDTQNIYLQDIHARITPQMWPVMSDADGAGMFSQMPQTFKDALKKAQVIEANHVLSPNIIEDKQQAGILAETVGQSKFMFKGGIRPLSMGLARETFEVIKTYLDFRVTLTRAP